MQRVSEGAGGEGEGEDAGDELETAHSISETLSTVLCATFVGPFIKINNNFLIIIYSCLCCYPKCKYILN